MFKLELTPTNSLIIISILLLNSIVTGRLHSEPGIIVESDQGFLAREMFCADRNFPIPSMTKGDRNFTEDCYKIGSFTNMDQLFNSKEISKPTEVYSLNYSKGNNDNAFKNAFFDLIENFPVTSLLVAKNNKVVAEYYGYARKSTQRFASFSMHKSFNAMLIGIAVQKKLIKNIDEPVSQYLSKLAGTQWQVVTIRQLLTMTSGIKPEHKKLIPLLFNNQSILDLVRRMDVKVAEPGTVFHYNSANTLVIGKLIERVFKKSWNKAFEQEIWSKIGAEANANVLTTGGGEPLTFAYFNARPRDYLRLGLLFTSEGKSLAGEQIISSEWMNKMLGYGEEFEGCPLGAGLNCAGLGPFGYTYQTWRNPSGSVIFFMGKYGQLILIHPASKSVAVILSAAKSGRWAHIFTTEMRAFLREIAR